MIDFVSTIGLSTSGFADKLSNILSRGLQEWILCMVEWKQIMVVNSSPVVRFHVIQNKVIY